MKEPKGVTVDTKGNVYAADTGNNRVEEFNEKGEWIKTVGGVGKTNGLFEEPKGVAIDTHNNLFVADTENGRVQKFKETGEWTQTIGAPGSGAGQLKEPRALAVATNGAVWVADTGNERVEVFKENGEWEKTVGSLGTGDGQFKAPKGITISSHNEVLVADAGDNRVEAFNEKGEYQLQFGSVGTGAGQLTEPWGIQVNSVGEVFVVDAENSRVEKWVPANPLAHDSQIVYYTPGTEASIVFCQNHPEWANLPCQTQPAHQPEDNLFPALPITTFTYNTLEQPETTVSTSGGATRTETNTYDLAGRPTSKEITSTIGNPLPKVSYEYNPETGMPVKQKTGSGAEEQKIISVYNTLGEMTSYTDADGNVATYEYENGKDARLKTVSDAKGTQTYVYDEEKTGEVKELTDSAAGKFLAGYDAELKRTTETLPDGLTSTITYNATDEPTGLEYHKATNCGTTCTWYTDSVIPSIHGEWTSQTSSLAGAASIIQNYGHDNTGRVTETQRIAAGKCTTHLYSNDWDGNRSTVTTRTSTEIKCAVEGGTNEHHSYDTTDRLVDPGTTYNPFGDIEALSATNAGGTELTSKYYVDGQVQNQTQGTQTIGYSLDPGRRTRETVSTGKVTATEIQNYSGPGSTPSWTNEPASGNSTRNIFGISGALTAIQHNSEAPTLQLANLHGDIIATAYDSETPSSLASTIAEASEFGIPATEAPPKYSWLGAHEIRTTLPSGVTAMGSRSYIPQLGRFLQPDPAPGGSADAYAYTHGNPLNETDLNGAWSLNQTSGGESSVGTGTGIHLEGGTGIAAGAIMPPPVNIQAEEAFWANPPWNQTTAGTEEYEEYEETGEEEEGEYEEAAYRQGKAGQQEAHLEEGLLYQPLGGEEGNGRTITPFGSAAPLCKASSEGPCIRRAGWFKAVFKVVVGTAAIAVGTVIYGVCVAGSEFTGVWECGTAVSAPIVGGALLVTSGLAELFPPKHHHRRSRR